MHRTCEGWIVVYVILADIIFMTFAAGPTWWSPSSTTITLDSTTLGVCDDVTSLIASSTDGSTVAYSISSQTPNGGFGIVQNQATYNYHLTCTVGSINVESYTVVVSARHNSGNNEESLLTLTIVFSNLADAAGPTWWSPSSTTITLDSTTSGVCDDVTSLIAQSSDGSTVVYSISSQTPDGGFDIVLNGATYITHLTCTVGSINAESYSVVVSARHDGGNNEETLLTLTIIFSNLAVTPTAPVFVKPNPDNTKPDHNIYIDETIQASGVVLQLSATDEDTDDTTLTFNMVASPEDTKELFEIDDATKQVKIKDSVVPEYFDVDREDAILEYFIVIVVSDGKLSTNLSTTISVTDVNDNPPVFSGRYSVDVLESANAGYSVLTFTVTDNDNSSPNNLVSLSLLGTSNFELRDDELIIADGADLSAGSSYYMTIIATDNAQTNSKSAAQLITINVKTDNEEIGDSNRQINGCKIGVDVGLRVVLLAFLSSSALA